MFDIKERNLLVGPITFLVLMYFGLVFIIVTKMNYQGKFEWKFLPIYPFVFLFLLVDFLYNLIIGSFLFMEFPREWLFTSRVERHKLFSDGITQDFAIYACKLMDKYDPGHCRGRI